MDYKDFVVTAIEAKEKKTASAPKTASYEFVLNSGTAWVIRKKTKTTSNILVHLPDEEVSDYIKEEKSGNIREVTEKTMLAFMDCAPHDGLPDAMKDENGRPLNAVLNKFVRGAEFARSYASIATKTAQAKNFNTLAKAGLLSINSWCNYKSNTSSYYSNSTWWPENMDDITPDVIKIAKYALKRQQDYIGVPLMEGEYALNQDADSYGSRSTPFTGCDRAKAKEAKVTKKSITAFILVLNRYNIDEARKWVDTYLANAHLNCLSGYQLAHVLCANRDGYGERANVWDLVWKKGDLSNHYVKHSADGLKEYIFSYSMACGYSDLLDKHASNLAKYYDLYCRVHLCPPGEILDIYPRPLSDIISRLEYRERLLGELKGVEHEWPEIEKVVKSFECSYGNYLLVAPKDTNDIVKEGSELRHCVASRVTGMLKKEYYVMFLRHKDNPEERLCTVQLTPKGELCLQVYSEVLNRTIYVGDNNAIDGNYNFRGSCNKEPSMEEKRALKAMLGILKDRNAEKDSENKSERSKVLEDIDKMEQKASTKKH